MKKVLLVLILVIISLSSSYSQFISYKFDEGLQAAKTEAEKKIGANSKFRAAAAAAGQFSILKSNIVLSTGKSELWVYVFEKNDNKDSIEAVPLIRSALGYSNVKTIVPNIDLTPYLAFLPKTIVTSSYILSNTAGTDIVNHAEYKSFMTSNPSATVSYFVLGNNETDNTLKMGEAYWNATISDGVKTMNCSVHAVTRETICKQIGQQSVESENPLENAIYPNPAGDYIYLDFPLASMSDIKELSMVDINGYEVMNLTSSLQNYNGTLQIPTYMIPSGGFFFKVTTKEREFLKQCTIVK